ncbi:hypothetical protein NOR_07011 [Metarhizium rileyi]|uniref:Uncharacterized protein n=1 Tax=Metarhizium rileyi (strain RCEF 4871) TaxID=1649241 RepID=A0A166Z7N0_METRR|nr:hypothetical protein NOR_07011 [Metarhizium rileyi RCEF 4871]
MADSTQRQKRSSQSSVPIVICTERLPEIIAHQPKNRIKRNETMLNRYIYENRPGELNFCDTLVRKYAL